MKKTFEELNEMYVPGNASTNFNNNTCRRRLLNKYVGEGNWTYIYEGRKAVAVEIHDEEVEIELEEVLDEQVEIELCYSSIKEHESEIERLKARIKELELVIESKPCISVKDVFKGINFRKYSWRKDIEDNYEDISKRYENNKHLKGIEKEYNKVMNRFLVQVYKHANSFYSWCEFCKLDRFDDFDRSTWNLWYSNIYNSNNDDWWVDRKTCEDYKKYFTINIKGIDVYIEGAEKLVNMFNGFGFENTKEYKYISQVVENMKEYKRKATEFNSKSESLFKEFCNGYSSYMRNRMQQEEDMFNNWRKQFTGGRTSSSSRRTGTGTGKKYFTGCTTKQELKKRYRELAKQLHPDHGGRNEEFVAMKAEYDELLKYAA